jgi:hypothetical protein
MIITFSSRITFQRFIIFQRVNNTTSPTCGRQLGLMLWLSQAPLPFDDTILHRCPAQLYCGPSSTRPPGDGQKSGYICYAKHVQIDHCNRRSVRKEQGYHRQDTRVGRDGPAHTDAGNRTGNVMTTSMRAGPYNSLCVDRESLCPFRAIRWRG